MQIIKVDDIFALHPELIVHPVNCQGLSRDALSRQLKKTWPDYFREYTRNCLRKKLSPGEAICSDLGTMLSTRYIVTLTVKSHWNDTLQPALVKPALQSLLQHITENGVTSVAMSTLKGAPDGWLEQQFRNLPEGSNKLEVVYLCDGE